MGQLSSLIWLLGIALSQASGDQSPVASLLAIDAPVPDSENAACAVLKGYVGLQLPSKKPDRYWFCDFTTIESRYVRVIGLRSNTPRNDGATIFSTLVGWYAVARRGRAVFQWEVAEQRLLAVTGDPLVEDDEQTACALAKARMTKLFTSAQDRWRCGFVSEEDEVLRVVTLWREPGRSGQSSKKVGKYAIARRSSLVLGIDESANRLVPLRN